MKKLPRTKLQQILDQIKREQDIEKYGSMIKMLKELYAEKFDSIITEDNPFFKLIDKDKKTP